MRTTAIVFSAALSILGALSGAALAGYTVDGAPVCVYTGNQEYPVVCSDLSGGAIIAWEDRRGYPDIYAQRIDANGRRLWTTSGVPICMAAYGQYGARICPDGAGGAYIAWTDPRASNVRDIYAQRIDANGTVLWTVDGAPVCTATGNQYLTDMCADGAGGAILVWQDERVSASYDEIYCQRIDRDGNLLWNPSGVALSTGGTFLRELAQAAPDFSGGGIFTWIDWGGGGIFAQRVNAAGIAQWAANGVAVCIASGNQYEPKIVSDDAGGAIIAWWDHRTWYDIYAQRVDGLGNMLWTPNGVQLTNDGGQQIWQAYARVCGDGMGGAIVAWIDQRANDYDCYAQRVNASGVPLWPANGIVVCAETGGCVEPVIMSAPDAGATVAWGDSRSGLGNDIYAQRLDSLGASLWTPGGEALCTALNQQHYPQLASDGMEGTIVVWEDTRVIGDDDIYASRIEESGSLVATLLQSSSWSARDGEVVISWVLAEAADEMRFSVLRARAVDRIFEALDANAIVREGMSCSFSDRGVDYGETYVYRVDVDDEDGPRTLFETSAIAILAPSLALHQNHPNPFNPSTTIGFSLPHSCSVTLDIYDALGRRVARLVDGIRGSGPHSVEWSGRDDGGRNVSSGVYYARLSAGKETLSRALVLIR